MDIYIYIYINKKHENMFFVCARDYKVAIRPPLIINMVPVRIETMRIVCASFAIVTVGIDTADATGLTAPHH